MAVRADVEVDALEIADDKGRVRTLGTSGGDVATFVALADLWACGQCLLAALATASPPCFQRIPNHGIDDLWIGKGIQLICIEPETVAVRAAIDGDAAHFDRSHRVQTGRAAADLFGSHGVSQERQWVPKLGGRARVSTCSQTAKSRRQNRAARHGLFCSIDHRRRQIFPLSLCRRHSIPSDATSLAISPQQGRWRAQT